MDRNRLGVIDGYADHVHLGGTVDRRVFVNYRGVDSHSYGALLYTELVRRFGEDLVFLDCESIPPGADFAAELLSRVRTARFVLAVIGPDWLTAGDATGRRIDDPDDWIRKELVEAFATGVRVIPILTDGATLPTAAELPADIVALSRCQARRLRRREPTKDLDRIVADLADLDSDLDAATRRSAATPGVVNTIRGNVSGPVLQAGTITGDVHLGR